VSVFRRRGTESQAIAEIDEPFDRDADGPAQDPTDDDKASPGRGSRVVRTSGSASSADLTGPFDIEQIDESEMRRLDFGSLLIPAVEGMQVRVEVDEQERVAAVSIMLNDTAIQLQAFAAPRSEELWDEVRQEIAEGIRGSQGKASESDGVFGRELRAEIMVTGPDGSTDRQPVRFIGVDGERWFLRGLISGSGVEHPDRAAGVESVFRQVAVRRGDHAAPPREPLPLKVPDDPGLVSEQGESAE
jgi:hypothetical protein